MKTILTVGTYDLTHYGHYRLFERCKKIVGNGKVVVGINTDAFIQKYKGRPPVLSYYERCQNVIACKWVDTVIENYGNETLKPLLMDIRPDFLVVGSDWAKKDYYTQIGVTQAWLDDMKIDLIYVPYTESISTTEIKRRMSNA